MPQKIYDISARTIQGETITLNKYAGKTLLVVNVASKCGFTHQYADLEQLYQKYHSQGLEILGFPTNDFLKQEPGSDQDIAQFCSLTYNVTFPMFSKITVKGHETHPLFKFLTQKKPLATHYEKRSVLKKLFFRVLGGKTSEVQWNFEKFLISAQGEVIDRWSSEVSPADPRFTEKILKNLPR